MLGCLGSENALFLLTLRIVCPLSYFKQITTLITLTLSLHLVLTVYIFKMGATYQRKSAFFWLVIWMVVATGLLYLFKGGLVLTSVAILANVCSTFVYGLYLIYETGFILDGNLYNTNHCESVFGAFILQYDLAGLVWFCAKQSKPTR